VSIRHVCAAHGALFSCPSPSLPSRRLPPPRARPPARPLGLQTPQLVDADDALISDILFYSTPSLHALAPPELGCLLWSLAQLRHSPDAAWMEALYAAAEPLLARLSREEVPLVMYALAQLQV
jgi:hypothetical protein